MLGEVEFGGPMKFQKPCARGVRPCERFHALRPVDEGRRALSEGEQPPRHSRSSEFELGPTIGNVEEAVDGMSSCVHLHDMRNGLQVSSREVVALDEWALLVDDLVDAKVRVEVGFYVFEKCNRTICASAAVHQLVSHSYPAR